MVLGFKSKLKVDLGDLSDEKDRLSSFLQSNLKVNLASIENNLIADSETLSPQELERIVNKFVYRRHLNLTHWVSLQGRTVKINKFKNKGNKKEEKRKK